MRCPRCQHENAPTMKFCGECGNPCNGVSPTAQSYADLRSEVESLRRALTESLEQQTATAEILGAMAALSLARALAPARAGGRGSSRLTAAPPPRTARTTAGVASPPSLTCNGRRAHRYGPSVGIGPVLGHVDLHEVVRCDRSVHQDRATHVVCPFTNRSG
jgi:hypothetical protein